MKQSLLGLLDLLNCLIFPDKVTLGAMVALHLSLIGGPVIGAAKPVVPPGSHHPGVVASPWQAYLFPSSLENGLDMLRRHLVIKVGNLVF